MEIHKEANNEVPELRSIQSFRKSLLFWFKDHKRNYPWRNTTDPFKVLIAEMLLRRTNADQVRPVFEVFIANFPNVESLAGADITLLETILAPLGLRRRAKFILSAAKEIKTKYYGKIGHKKDDLLALPGVGDYIAGAIMSIALGKQETMIDSNVVRVLGRYFGILTSKRGYQDKRIIESAKRYVRTNKTKEANFALLDLAALICKSRNPTHEICPVRNRCKYYLG